MQGAGERFIGSIREFPPEWQTPIARILEGLSSQEAETRMMRRLVRARTINQGIFEGAVDELDPEPPQESPEDSFVDQMLRAYAEKLRSSGVASVTLPQPTEEDLRAEQRELTAGIVRRAAEEAALELGAAPEELQRLFGLLFSEPEPPPRA